MKKITTFPSNIRGKVNVSGSKNASLPIIVASLLNNKETTLKGIPQIKDINNLLTCVKKIGCDFKLKKNKLQIHPTVNNIDLLFPEIKDFRASYYFMGLFLALFNEVKIFAPGGCKIGARPIDYHLAGFRKAGVKDESSSDVIHLKAIKLVPFTYTLPSKSLGATVNLIILATKINGLSVIKNASTEPEIDDLICFLNCLEVKIRRQGDAIFIYGKNDISKKVSYRVMPDRIEAFTFICLGAYSRRLIVNHINIRHLTIPLIILKKMGLRYKLKKNKIIIYLSQLNGVRVMSGHYPQISTDQMPILYPLLIRAEGISILEETIFENRFAVCEELKKNNAQINVEGSKVRIVGKTNIIGASLFPKDLRGAAALLIEAIIDGQSCVYNLEHLERGYERIYHKLKRIGLKFIITNVDN